MKQFIKNNLYNNIGRLNSRKLNENWFNNNNFTSEYTNILSTTSFLSENTTLKDRIIFINNDSIDKPKCLVCGESHQNIVGKTVISKYCSSSCSNKSQEKKDKTKLTNISKYGDVSWNKSDISRKKISVTMKENWSKNRNSIIEKRNKTNECIYGCDPSQQHIPANIINLINDKLLLQKFLFESGGLVQKLSKELNIYYGTVISRLRDFDLYRHPYITYNQSSFEIEIYNYIKSLGIPCESSNRSILGKQELDIYIPEKLLAIECNGLYWHSEISGNKSSSYHIDKTIQCESKNISLLHIFDSEWNNPVKNDILKSVISSKLGINNRIFARQCTVMELDDCKLFMNNNHIQGYIPSKVKIGLEYNNEIVAVMTLSKPRFNKSYEWEIIRYANKKYNNVIGGFSKILSYFEKKYNPKSIISYADRRYSQGNVYLKTGFTLLNKSKPSYMYTDYLNLYNRMNFQKHKLKGKLTVYDDKLSAWKNLLNNRYDRIWDCGTIAFVKEL